MSNDLRILTVERSTSTAHRLLHYDGVCGNVHGHNMRWEAEVQVDMGDAGEDNMPVDLKDISDVIDRVDHAILLNEQDPLVVGSVREKQDAGRTIIHRDALGEVYTFEGDPTCECIVEWMAEQILELNPVVYVNLTCHETDKYGVSTKIAEWADD